MRLHGGTASGVVAVCAVSAGAGWATQPASLPALADVILAALYAPALPNGANWYRLPRAVACCAALCTSYPYLLI